MSLGDPESRSIEKSPAFGNQAKQIATDLACWKREHPPFFDQPVISTHVFYPVSAVSIALRPLRNNEKGSAALRSILPISS